MLNEGGLELQISPSCSKYVSVQGWNVKQENINCNNRNKRDSCILCLVNLSLKSPRTSYCVYLQTLAVSANLCPTDRDLGNP